jgi:uncharacterized protein YjbI with pentapeptide repeats
MYGTRVAVDPKDLSELQRALNDAAGKASALWITFVTFQLYLAIAFGSVTHRNLFLEDPIKLPVLNVDLPLVGFFVVAPTLLVILHFYVFLQLLGLAITVKDYDTLLVREVPDATDRQYLRRRLDSFPVLQFLAGPRDQRTGFSGFSLRLITWITLVATPVLVLLQGQVTFLPYHGWWVVWLQRIAVLIDLAVIWYFWVRIRGDDDSGLRRVPRKAWTYLGGVVGFCVVIFSFYLATFPGEWVDEHLPKLSIPTTWRPHWSEETDWTSLSELLFEGRVDEVTGRPRSLFSNRLVLTDQSFVDSDKLDKVRVSRSFRGRDLSQAVLNRADLRKVDFTGARLNGAQFEEAKLLNAFFNCARIGKKKRTEDPLDSYSQENLGCTGLQGASLNFAQLQGANFFSARLQGASLVSAQLQGASLISAQLQGVSLKDAQLQGADLAFAQLQGAELDGAHLQAASLLRAHLQGASLNGAELSGAKLNGAQLQGASLNGAKLLGASLSRAEIWRTRGTPNLDLADLGLGVVDTKVWNNDVPKEKRGTFAEWRDAIANSIPAGPRRDLVIARLAAIDPAAESEPADALDRDSWKEKAGYSSKLQDEERKKQDEERKKKRAVFLTDLACSNDAAPYVAQGLLNIFSDFGEGPQVIIDKLHKGKSDLAACPGVKGFIDEDWARLAKLSGAN